MLLLVKNSHSRVKINPVDVLRQGARTPFAHSGFSASAIQPPLLLLFAHHTPLISIFLIDQDNPICPLLQGLTGLSYPTQSILRKDSFCNWDKYVSQSQIKTVPSHHRRWEPERFVPCVNCPELH